jgi:hypothetical protein
LVILDQRRRPIVTGAVAPSAAPAPSASDNLAVDCTFAYRHLVAIDCVHRPSWTAMCEASERAGVSMHLVCVEAAENCVAAKKCLGEP